MSTAVIFIFALLPLLAYFVKGIVGAASAIVFNAALLLGIAFGLNGEVSLRDGLYWVGMADFVTSFVLWYFLRRDLRPERQTVLLLAGMLPVSIVFALMIESIDLGWLMAALAIAITLAGIWLIYSRDHELARESTLNWIAFPCGLLSGVLSGLFSMAGPVVILFLAAGSKDPRVLRARLVFISLCANTARMTTLVFAGAYTEQRMKWAALSAPAVLIGLLAGNACARFVKPVQFRVMLGVLVAIAGIAAGVKVFL
ncbi:MAG: sulfite exporter TauE/SafE family protein [Planctomycetes bacterium]|nr:sulfite exporter TauE/SafE family protein [Planctomycetota bacterium]